MRKIFFLLGLLLFLSTNGVAQDKSDSYFIHLKTGLKHDDAQICVAYNIIWAALRQGYKVNVLIDADAINTYKKGWSGKDGMEGYKIPENLRKALSSQFNISLASVPSNYGDYLEMLHREGAKFYINSGFLIVSKIGTPGKLLENLSVKFFKPVSLAQIIELRANSAFYFAY